MSEANLEEANLSDASFHCTKLTSANLKAAEMFNITISFADLTKANLKDSISFRVGFKSHTQGTIFEETIMPDGTVETSYWV